MSRHLSVISNPHPERRNHPSQLPARDTRLLRETAASLVERWAAGFPVTAVDAQRVIDALLDDRSTA